MSEQREQIIDCSKRLLKELGYHAFSMHKVAEESNLELRYLHTYFASKSLLLSAVASSFLESYWTYLDSCQIDKSKSAQQDLYQWLLHLLEYRESEDCATIFKELWVIAVHDQEIRLVLDQYYRLLQQIIYDKLHSIVADDCSQHRIELASCFLLPFIEGYGVTRSTLPISLLQLSKQLSQSLLAILSAEE